MSAGLTGRLLIGAAASVTMLVCGASVARAGIDKFSDDTTNSAGTRISEPDVHGLRQASGSDPTRPVCRYVPAEPYTIEVPGGPTTPRPITRDRGTLKEAPRGENTETLFYRHCPAGGTRMVWVTDGVDVQDLIDAAHAEEVRKIPDPALDMNPDPSVGGVVNIGLWMAVDDPGQVSATAELGPIWATVTARYERTTWDMGNGDVVECEGLGVPITDTNTVEQGPCGYTYEWPSAPKFTDGGMAYTSTVTGHWVITYDSSAGGGTLDPIDTTTAYSYTVREIQVLNAAG